MSGGIDGDGRRTCRTARAAQPFGPSLAGDPGRMVAAVGDGTQSRAIPAMQDE